LIFEFWYFAAYILDSRNTKILPESKTVMRLFRENMNLRKFKIWFAFSVRHKYLRMHAKFLTVIIVTILSLGAVKAQDTVTGAFEGTISNNQTGKPLAGAFIEIINEQTGVIYNLQSDSKGRFYQGLLAPGIYLIRVSTTGFRPRTLRRELKVSFTGEVVPVPVALEPETGIGGVVPPPEEPGDIRVEINTSDARQDGSNKKDEVVGLPLGATTITKTFDELAFLLPGVAPPPQTIGDTTGPGVGPGVGSAGQFAVNGLRSRGNNFTVDGSDNNDEDIGVRRQGFVALIPQPLESIEEYQIITLLAPAQFGRNIGAQVNAVSKSGGNLTRGTLYGSFNSDKLNARNFFDTTNGNERFPLQTATGQPVLLDGQPIMVRNQSSGEDSFTFLQGGATLGGAIRQRKLFYFLSGEYQKINATKEKNFIVPTVEQRGAFGTGASGIFRNPFTNDPVSAIPSTLQGSALFSLFPFANNPAGIYGVNTFTQNLPTSGEGVILSAKIDNHFRLRGRQQSVTGRYNFTADERYIPAVNEAIFSTLLSKIQTHNFSFFLNSQLSRPSSIKPIFNQIRLSFGRTRLDFSEVRDREFLIPSDEFPNVPFLLNAPLKLNITQPQLPGRQNNGPVKYRSVFTPVGANTDFTSESQIDILGQVNLAGFSSLGVDVYNFPQLRVNNTYQIADELSARLNNHSLAFGVDLRRTDLDSDLPRLARPLVNFNGTPRLIFENGAFRFPTAADPNPIILAEDLAALGAASDFLLTFNVNRADSKANLRYYQLNFYGQDTWRISPKFSLSYGLRYEYNSPVKEVNNLIEQTFTDSRISFVPGLLPFIAGRKTLYEPDLNNLAPRVGAAYTPRLFKGRRVTVLRAGYGIFYDQILGAVVNQSRNVFPTFFTFNFGGVEGDSPNFVQYYNPAGQTFLDNSGNSIPLRSPGTVNAYNQSITFDRLFQQIRFGFPNAVNATLPSRNLEMPMAQHFTIAFEQQLSSNFTVSMNYVRTVGAKLLRFTTPNLGSGIIVAPTVFQLFPTTVDKGIIPFFLTQAIVKVPNRPVRNIGAVNLFETNASSNYNALQIQIRGRFLPNFNFQVSYTLSKVIDDVSDVFDLSGSYALPQNSFTRAGERAAANFDVRNRLTYSFTYNFPQLKTNKWFQLIAGNLQIAGTGRFQTGQPFTVNSTIDVNLDGNLTDRLNTIEGIEITGNRQQPLRLKNNNFLTLLAPFGEDGAVQRNNFRAGRLLELDLSIAKHFVVGSRRVAFRTDIFNFINRANFGIPVRFLESAAFGKTVSTNTSARRLQFSLKYEF
jgi:hypothetical protein